VIARQLRDLAVADAVAAAVADVRDVHAAALARDEGTDDGRAHAVHLAVTGARLEDALVRDADAGDEPVLLDREVRVEVERPGRVFLGGRLEEGRHGVRRHLAGNVPGAVAAHAIRNDVEIELRQDAERILVVLSLLSDVRDACRDDLHAWRERSPIGGAGVKHLAGPGARSSKTRVHTARPSGRGAP
jgi:hypothetical protein